MVLRDQAAEADERVRTGTRPTMQNCDKTRETKFGSGRFMQQSHAESARLRHLPSLFAPRLGVQPHERHGGLACFDPLEIVS